MLVPYLIAANDTGVLNHNAAVSSRLMGLIDEIFGKCQTTAQLEGASQGFTTG